MRATLLTLLAALTLQACGTTDDARETPAPQPVASQGATGPTAPAGTSSPTQPDPVASTTAGTGTTPAPPSEAAQLTPAQLVGQRLIASFRGTTVPPQALLDRIRRGEVAGVLLFGENAPTVAAARKLVDRLQAIPRPGIQKDLPLLVLSDQEGGVVRRLTDAPPSRSALQAARAGSASGVQAEGRRTARALRRAGVSADLAPVADVPRAGSALLRETRTYGTTAAQVRAYAPAFARGLVAGGVQATAKHFPGFGAATVNTDAAPATIRLSKATLRRTDEAADQAVVAAGARLVMVANAIYPALDAKRPASLSRAIATTELRGHLGFTGVSITDDLQAGALTSFGAPGRLAVLSARAGVDLLVFGSTAQATEDAAAALQAANLPEADLLASADRVLALRRLAALP